MLGIRILGRFEISPAAGPLGSKPHGLLAVLAMSRGAAVPRGRLAGLLWSERDEQRARHSLCQALTTLRSTLGPAASLLQVTPDGVRLSGTGLVLDVETFEGAARSREQAALEEACALYRGPFLEGLEIREPGFEEWQFSERYRLGELAADAFAKLLDLQMAAGAAEAAIATGRRLVAMTPLDEPAHARLIELYGTLGRRGLAEAQYARCADLLRRELDRAPGAELRAAIAAARRAAPAASTRFVPGLRQAGARTPDARRMAARPWLAAGTVGAMLLLAGAWIFHSSRIGDDTGSSYQAAPWAVPADPSIAVLPFETVAGDPQQASLADGITNDLITDLSKFSGVFVTASGASSRYRGREVDAQGAARALGVRYVLEGSVRQADGTLWIHARLIDGTTGRHVWAERYQRPTGNLLAAQQEITRTIVGVVASGWGELQRAELERIRDVPAEDLAAYDLYLRGMAYKNRKSRENNALARQMFERAIEADPSYAKAMAEASLAYLNDVFNDWTGSREDALREAEALARRAVAIDPSEPWGFVALGLVYQLEGREDRALALFETAHTLNPNDYDVKEALGYATTWSGSAERGVELLEQAQQLNPYHAGEPRTLGAAYFFSHRYEDALATVNAVTDRERTPGYWLYKAAAHAQLGQLDEASAAVAEALELDPDLTLQSQHARRLALGLAPAYAEHLTEALRKAGLPEREVSLLAR